MSDIVLIKISDVWNSINSFFGDAFQHSVAYCGDEFKNLEPIDSCQISSLILIFILIVALFVFTSCNRKIFRCLSKCISITAFIVWILGVLVYIVGFYDKDLSALAVVPRAIISSFKMFLASNDLARVHEGLRANTEYMTWFSLIHFAAAFITFIFIFKMIGFKVRCSWNILLHRFFKSKGRVVHLFWGVNDASLLLAEDIRKKEKCSEGGQKSDIIFIDIDEENVDNTKRKLTLAHITDAITVTDSEIDRLLDIQALVGHCYNGPALLDGEAKLKDVFGSLNLKSIGRIVHKSSASFFYFMSDDEDKNIAGALNLQKDQRLLAMPVLPEIYVHARRDASNEVFDHYQQYDDKSRRMRIKVIDSSFLAIIDLKQSKDSLPVKCVKYDKKTGLVDSPFTALIIGFGETGQEAFKFLYEFSAFVGPDMRKSPFKCYAIDEKMNKISGLFRVKMPEIKDDELALLQMSVESEEYWNKLESVINDLNYVVIALNDDMIGLSTAVEFFKYALKYRSDSSQVLKIMLRCYESANENKMNEVIRSLDRSADGFKIEMKLFGEKNTIFNSENTRLNTVLKEAKAFHYVYSNPDLSYSVLRGGNDKATWEKSVEEQWETDFIKDKETGITAIEKAVDKVRKKGKSLSRYHAIYDLNRMMGQNLSNVLHQKTKLILMGLDDSQISVLEHYYDIVCTRDNEHEKIEYQCSKEESDLLHNMAMIEHERWIAAHKLMGFTLGPEKDMVQKKHSDMVHWTELSESIESYDCQVVDTTIRMAYQKALRNNKND